MMKIYICNCYFRRLYEKVFQVFQHFRTNVKTREQKKRDDNYKKCHTHTRVEREEELLCDKITVEVNVVKNCYSVRMNGMRRKTATKTETDTKRRRDKSRKRMAFNIYIL